MPQIAIHYHTDPTARIASGIDSFIRGILRHAPDDLQYTLVGATTDARTRPPGRYCEIDVGGRLTRFLPLIAVDSEGRRGALPITAYYMAALARQVAAGRLRRFDVLDFHRIEPLLLLGGDRRPKNLTLHLDMVAVRDPASDILWRHMPRLYERLESHLMRRADRVYCVRRTAVDRYRSQLPERADAISFLPTWYDSSRFSIGSHAERGDARREMRSRLGWPDDARVLICVGRLDRQKDPLLLIEAVAPLMKRDPRLRLLMVGDGGLRSEVESRIGSQGLGDRTTLAGARHGHEIARMLKASDVFVMTSAYEGMPIAVLEALASGLPVVSTPVGEVPALIQSGVNGMLAAGITASAVREALQAILQMREPPLPAVCAASVRQYRPEVVLGPVYENHRRQARGPATAEVRA